MTDQQMSAETAEEGIRLMMKQLNGKMSGRGLKLKWAEIISFPAAAISDAVDHFCAGNSFMPTPEQFLDRIKLAARSRAAGATDEREAEWNRQKGGADRRDRERQATIFTREQSDLHGRRALQLLRLAINPEVKRADILDGFRAMEASHPGPGWGLEGAKLKKGWEDRCKACVVGREDLQLVGRDMSQARRWYGCYGRDGCKAVV